MTENRKIPSSGGGGLGVLGLLFLLLVTFKLTGTGQVAGWSWWWVTAPLWSVSIVGAVAVLLDWSSSD